MTILRDWIYNSFKGGVCLQEERPISIKLLYAMEYSPKRRKAVLKSRPQHSFLHIIRGICEYKIGKEVITVSGGESAYLPKGASYSYEFIGDVYCRQVEFDTEGDITDLKKPFILSDKEISKNYIDEILKLYGLSGSRERLAATGQLYCLCALIPEEKETKARESRIKPAIDYINEHFCEKFSIGTLADLCFMSEAQLRRYFKTEINTTPIDYKNRLRIEKAKSVLLYDVASIGETAERLGFENVYAFSSLFKKYVGRSPSDFAEINKSKSRLN